MTNRDLARLAGVHPILVRTLVEVFDEMEAEGTPMFVVEGLRTVSRQAELYSLGRTKPGQVVTYKDGVKFKSNHQPHNDGFGYAVDCAFLPNGKITDVFSRTWPWGAYGVKLEAHGLIWGGRWKMSDLPHAELPAQTGLLADASPTPPSVAVS